MLKSEYDDNLIIFWSGHGNDIKPHNLLWGQKEEITGEYMKRLLSSMKNNGKYRKLLFVVEACYAGGIAKSCEGIEGLLFFTSANEFEQSFGDIHDNNLNVYRSNRFSKSFINKVRNNNHSYITDIYYSTFKETMGSHVTLYNYKNFGNIYYSNIGEFIIK